MNRSWTIEQLKTIDDSQLESLADVLIDCVDGGASVSFMSPLTRERALAFWRRVADSVDAQERALLIAANSEGVCGTVQVIWDLPENQPHRADLAKMLVHRRARRQGVGAALVSAAEHVARQRGKSLLVLDTVTGSEASRLYERLGWRRVGDVPGFALMPNGDPCSTTYYYRDLTSSTPRPERAGVRVAQAINRPAAPSDFPSIFPLLQQLWTDAQLDPAKLAEAFAAPASAPHQFQVCRVVNERVVGFATLSLRHSLWQQASIGYVGELVVNEDDRGQGHGKALLDHLSGIAASRGCSLLELDSGFHRTEAHAVYEHCGMTKRGFLFSKVL
jgi:GNAT superfamily N-acetyltransferase